MKPSARSCSRPSSVILSGPHGGSHTQLIRKSLTRPPPGPVVNAVVPGTADTPWVGRLLAAAEDPEAAAAALRGRQPTGRLVTAAEVAHAIAYLASPLTSATTGTLLAVDGGVTGVRLPT